MRQVNDTHAILSPSRAALLPPEPIMSRARGYQTRGGLKTGWGCQIAGRMNRFGQWPVIHAGAFSQRIDGERVDVDVLEYHWPNGACIGDPAYDTHEYAVWADAYTRLKALLRIQNPQPTQLAEIALLAGAPMADVCKALGVKLVKAA